MAIAEQIHERARSLPKPIQIRVLNFVELLAQKAEVGKQNEVEKLTDREWSEMSLEMAMRGMEDEETDYTLADLKEIF